MGFVYRAGRKRSQKLNRLRFTTRAAHRAGDNTPCQTVCHHRKHVQQHLSTAKWLPRAPELELRGAGGRRALEAIFDPLIRPCAPPRWTSRRRGMGLTGRGKTRGDATRTGGLCDGAAAVVLMGVDYITYGAVGRRYSRAQQPSLPRSCSHLVCPPGSTTPELTNPHAKGAGSTDPSNYGSRKRGRPRDSLINSL